MRQLTRRQTGRAVVRRNAVRHPQPWPSVAVLAMACGLVASARAAGAEQTQPVVAALERVDVLSKSPIPALGQVREELPYLVQSASSADMRAAQSLNLSDFLGSQFSGVHVNDNAGNPYQMDISYRGFTASPLLGTPQGLSVYLDGVRMNQSFGDTVMWDLIPTQAVQNLSLVAGSNPLFGLNTLGGAIALQTKDGLHAPGTRVEWGVGRFGRRSLNVETGGSNAQGLDWYGLLSDFSDRGWRVESASQVQHAFGKLGWQNASTQVAVTAASFQSKLSGNGLQQAALMQTQYNSVFTPGDQTASRARFFNLQARHEASAQTLLSGNLYARATHTATVNPDLNGESLGEKVYGYSASDKAWLIANGLLPSQAPSVAPSTTGTGLPYLRCLAQAGQAGEPNEKCNALLTRTQTDQNSWGLAGQLTTLAHTAWGRHHALLGFSFDDARSQYAQTSQFGYLKADRSVKVVNAFADGTQDSETAFDQRVNLSSRARSWSLLSADTWSPTAWAHLTASARYNTTHLSSVDNLFPYNNALLLARGNLDGVRGSLAGDHRYARLNPAVGVAFTPSTAFNPYFGYSESNRAPTGIELGCADPDFGCRLPTGMTGDPDLKQVTTQSWEFGARGKWAGSLVSWNAALFQANNQDDIQFVATSTQGTGYFKNFGQTRRKGLELGLSGAYQAVTYRANYTYLKATYESAESFHSAFNAAADANGNIRVKPGDQMPLIPRHLLNLRLAYAPSAQWRSALTVSAVGSSFTVGNANNADPAKLPGYALLGWTGEYDISKQWRVLAHVANLTNRHYATSAQLGPYAFTSTGAYTNGANGAGSVYAGPGAPRSLGMTLRYALD